MDTGDVLAPVITRDDFQRGKVRTDIYKHLLAIEGELKAALDRETAKQRVVAMSKLEGVMVGVLDAMARADRRELRRAARRAVRRA